MSLSPKDSNAIDREDLLRKGFHFDFFTHIRKTEGGAAYYCYDLGIAQVNGRSYKLLKE